MEYADNVFSINFPPSVSTSLVAILDSLDEAIETVTIQ